MAQTFTISLTPAEVSVVLGALEKFTEQAADADEREIAADLFDRDWS